MKKVYALPLLFLFFLFTASISHAVQINIFGTGVDENGALTASGTADAHYSLIDPNGNVATAKSAGNGHSAWVNPVSNGYSAQWITPGGTIGDVGFPYWKYSIEFDLSGFDSTTANIVGVWSSDNQGRIFLNGTDTSFATGLRAFESYHNFSLSSGFIEGINTLTFEVLNAENRNSPSGLFVDIVSASAQVPEPGTLLLLGSGLAGLALYRRRMNKM